MSVVLDTKIDIRKIVQAVDGYEHLRSVLVFPLKRLAEGIENKENFFLGNEFNSGDIDGAFGFNISENPSRCAVVWASGYSTQFSLYADTYDENYVDHYAVLGLAILMQHSPTDGRARPAKNLILMARDKALGFIKSQPEVVRQSYELVSEQLEAYKSKVEQEAKRLKDSVEELERKQREELEAYKLKVNSELALLKESVSERSIEAKYLELAYTKEQRKANKARASAIRLKARTMSFLDKRSIR